MNLDQYFIGKLHTAAKAYNAENESPKRAALGAELDRKENQNV